MKTKFIILSVFLLCNSTFIQGQVAARKMFFGSELKNIYNIEKIDVTNGGDKFICGLCNSNFILESQMIGSPQNSFFIAKFNKYDSLIWLKNILITWPSPLLEGRGSIYSDGNNCYFSFIFRDSILIGSQTLYSKGERDIIIGKIDENGTMDWNFQIGGKYNEGMGNNAICFDDNKNLFIYSTVGYGAPSIDSVFAGIGYYTTNGGNAFLLKLDSNANILHYKLIDFYSGDEFASSIVYQNTGLYYVLSELPFNNYNFDGINFNVPITYGKSCALVRSDTNGNPNWIRTFGGDDFSTVSNYSIKIDNLGRIVLLNGGFDVGHFNFSNSSSITQVSNQFSHCLVKYDTTGNLLWKQASVNYGNTGAGDIVCGKHGEIYLVGDFSGHSYFTKDTLHSISSTNMFLACYDSLGNVSWAKQGGGNGKDLGKDVAVDSAGNIYIVGATNSATFDMDALSELTPGSNNLFIVKLGKIGVDTKDITPSKNAFRLYPNPLRANENLYIETGDLEISKIRIYTIYGQLIQEIATTNHLTKLALNELSPANYLLQIETNNNTFYTQLFTKQ